MRRVGILAPMPSELGPAVEALGLTRRPGRGRPVFTGRVGRADVVAAGTGIGPELAARATARLLDDHGVDLVVVCGIAGGIEGATVLGALVTPAEVIDAADGTRFRAATLSGLELAGTIRTGDGDSYRLGPHELDHLRNEGVVGLDMETAAVARVCEPRQVPWVAFRGISDMAGDATVGEDVLTLVHPDGTVDARAAVRFFLRHPSCGSPGWSAWAATPARRPSPPPRPPPGSCAACSRLPIGPRRARGRIPG